MYHKFSECFVTRVRAVLLAAWLLLIIGLFFDPVSQILTDVNHNWSPLQVDPSQCIQVQGQCFDLQPYALAPAIFWGIVLPLVILSFLTFGNELWRRICPLSLVSQIPKKIGIQRRERHFNLITERVNSRVPKIRSDSWLGKNHIYLQFGFLYLGLCGRILFFNANRPSLAALFIGIMLAAIAVGYFYTGKSWCQYFCPMAPVQSIYMQPMSLFSSQAHTTGTRPPQSMCRVPTTTHGRDKIACVGCKTACIDIDSERSYWSTINQPQQSFLRYGYWGLVMGYFAYYYLYAGNWDYYLSGVWAQDVHQLEALYSPGFYLGRLTLAIPKLIAAPMTLAAFTALGYWLGRWLESAYEDWLFRQRSIVNPELVRHRLFSLVTFSVFHVYFAFGGRPFLKLLPLGIQYSYQGVIILFSLLWLRRVWGRSYETYQLEKRQFKIEKNEGYT